MTVPTGLCQCGCGQKTQIAAYNLKRLGWTKGEPVRYLAGHHTRGKRVRYEATRKTRTTQNVLIDGERCVSIPISGNRCALVSEASYSRVQQMNWGYSRGYAVSLSSGDRVWMHRLICDTPDGFDTDHINGNRLDNRDSNLRVATRQQNQQNRGVFRLSSTGIRGVVPSKGKFKAQIKIAGKSRSLGVFGTVEEAAKVRREAERREFGEFLRKVPA